MALSCSNQDGTQCSNGCKFTLNHKNLKLLTSSSLRSLKEIIIQNTELTELPQCFALHLTNVESLILSGNKLEALPPDLKGFENLKYLDVSKNQIKFLPSHIASVTTLRILNISENSLTNIPNIVCYLSHLQKLNVSKNKLKFLPSDIKCLSNLIILDVSDNLLEDVPQSIGSLTKLSVLNLARNELQNLPESLESAVNLRVLNLSYNKFCEFPICFHNGLPSITVLDFSYNCLTNITVQPKCANMLRTLNFSNNKLSNIPNWLFQDVCRNLTDLNISHNNEMQGLQQEVGMLLCASKIENINMSDCSLIPATIKFLKKMVNLKSIHLGNVDDKIISSRNRYKIGNTFMELPVDLISPCVKLQKLYLPSVGLTDIPFMVNRLAHCLEVFDVSYNEISWLPDSFCDFCNLTTLMLSNNTLVSLPTNIGQLSELCYLSIDGNFLQSLPESIKFLEKLKYLDLYNNEFECVPEVVFLIPCLEALDIELNRFDTSDLSKQETKFIKRYRTMKEQLRFQLKNSVSVLRVDNFKEPYDNECEEENDSHSDSSESLGESDENDLSDNEKGDKSYDQNLIFLPETGENSDQVTLKGEEEDWNYVDDPSNYFDPNVPWEKQVPRHSWDLAKYIRDTMDDSFCPEDQHAPRLPRCSKRLQLPQDGQFDDADI